MKPSMMAKQLQMSPPPKSKKMANIGGSGSSGTKGNKTQQIYYPPGKQNQNSPMVGQPGGPIGMRQGKTAEPVKVGKKDTGYPPMIRNRSSDSDDQISPVNRRSPAYQ